MDLSFLAAKPVPQALMIAGGVIAGYLAVLYLQDRESQKYKASTFLGLLVGLVLLVGSYAVFRDAALPNFSLSVMLLTGFALFFRPIQRIPIAAVVGLLVGVIVYIYLGEISDPAWELVTVGTGRIVVSAVVTLLIFTALNFVEQILDFTSMVLNAWPVLMILGVLSILDAASLLIYDDSLLAVLVASGAL